MKRSSCYITLDWRDGERGGVCVFFFLCISLVIHETRNQGEKWVMDFLVLRKTEIGIRGNLCFEIFFLKEDRCGLRE